MAQGFEEFEMVEMIEEFALRAFRV